MSFRINPLFVFAGASAVGAAAGAALDPSDLPAGERMQRGAVLGAGLGAAAYYGSALPSGFLTGTARMAGNTAWRGFGRYLSGMERDRKAAAAAGKGVFGSFMAGYGRIGVFAAAGAIAGAAMNDEDRISGAAYGAAAGVGARGAIRLMQGFSKIPPKFGMRFLSVLALAGGLGMAGAAVQSPAVHGEPDPEDERLIPTGVRGRMNAMNADGSIVFGAHNRR